MANRTTFTKVKEIYPTDMSDEGIEAYISIANVLVDDAAAIGTLSDVKLAEIERWLTAHLIVVTQDRRTIEEEIGADTRVKYSDRFGKGLEGSEYGQMVTQLDTTGTLKNLGKKRVDITAITSFS